MVKRAPSNNKDDGKKPHRRCIVSGEELPKESMIRFVLGPENEIVADIDCRLPGRGFWLSPSRDVINTACAKKAFARAARANVSVPADLADRVEDLLAKKCLDQIGLARRAGEAVSGFEKVEIWLKSGKPVGLLLSAADGAGDGLRKIRHWAGDAPVVEALDARELGQAFARERTVHAVLSPGRLAEGLLANGRRLEGLRMEPSA